MRRWVRFVGLGLAAGIVAGIGCAAGADPTTTATGGGASSSTGEITTGGMGGTDIDGGSDAPFDPDAACATFTAEAKQAPAAILFVLDKSASMNNLQKWTKAQQAVVAAIDKDGFDTTSLGLVTFPQSYTNPPQCLCDYYMADPATCAFLVMPGVSCGIGGLPEVPLTPAGTDKSNAPQGVRHDIYQKLVSSAPLSNSDDGSPIYDALVAGYDALKLYNIDKRITVLLTDGGFSCTSLASPPRPGYDDGACDDWEYPDSVNTLINGARTDASKPIFTFIVGLPGSNSTGGPDGPFATAPYHMRLALSTYAVSGSPDTVNPACDKAAVFTQNGADPAVPCHVDLSNGASFNPDALAQAIADIRGKALGCIYDLPPAPPGETIDLAKVNVQVTVEGVVTPLKKRSDPADACTNDGCWDYKDENGVTKVEIIGKSCADVTVATDAKVDIFFGCATEIK